MPKKSLDKGEGDRDTARVPKSKMRIEIKAFANISISKPIKWNHQGFIELLHEMAFSSFLTEISDILFRPNFLAKLPNKG